MLKHFGVNLTRQAKLLKIASKCGEKLRFSGAQISLVVGGPLLKKE